MRKGQLTHRVLRVPLAASAVKCCFLCGLFGSVVNPYWGEPE
jgi:hypothetical protein